MSEAVTAPGQTQVKRRRKKAQPATSKRRRGPGIDFSALTVTETDRPMGRGAPPRLSDAHRSVLETLNDPDSARKLTVPAHTKPAIFVREFRRVLKKHRPDVKLMSATLGKGEIKLWVVPIPFDGEFPATGPQPGDGAFREIAEREAAVAR